MQDARSEVRATEHARPSRGEFAVVALLCVLGFVLRFRGIGFLLPSLPLSDSYPIAQQVDWLHGKPVEGFVEDLMPYPPLLGRLAAIWPQRSDDLDASPLLLDDHLARASEPWLQIRIVATCLSMLIVPGTWLLARRFLSPRGAVLAAALVTASLMHVNFAVHEKPHGPLSGILPWAVLAGISLRRQCNVPSYVFAGVAIGLCVAMLHSGIVALSILPAAVLLRDRRAGAASAWWTIGSVAIILLAARLSYPLLFHADSAQARVFKAMTNDSTLMIPGHEVSKQILGVGGFEVVFGGLWSYDPVLFIGCAAGVVAFAVSRSRARTPAKRIFSRDAWVVLAFALPYLLALGFYPKTLDRFQLPLLPVFACVAAFGFDRVFTFVCRRIASPTARAASSLGLCFACAAVPLIPAWRLGSLRQTADTFSAAAQWIEERASPAVDRIVTTPGFDLPVLYSASAMDLNARHADWSNWVRYQMTVPEARMIGARSEILVAPGSASATAAALRSNPAEYFRSQNARWVVIPAASDFEGVRKALADEASSSARIAPDSVEHEGLVNFTYLHARNSKPWTRPMFAAVLSMERMGWTLDVFQLKRPI